MALHSAPPHTEHVPWRGLLLTASLLTFWNVPTTAQLTLEAVPPIAAEGQSVLLRALNLGENLRSYNWFKAGSVSESHLIARYKLAPNSTKPGAAYSGRETIYHNGSLLLQNLTQKDTGPYTLLTENIDSDSEIASVEFGVYQLLTQPTIQASTTTVTEEYSVNLTCLSRHTGLCIQWSFNNQTLWLTDRMKLSQDNITLRIFPVTSGDAGEYRCEVSNPVSSSKSDSLRLAVIPKETLPGLPSGAVSNLILLGVSVVASLGCLLLFIWTGRPNVQRDF